MIKIWYGVALASLWVAFSGWAISSPAGSAPDDDFHIGSIWCAGGFESGICQDNGQTAAKGEKLVLIPVARNFCYAYKPSESGNCLGSESAPSLQEFRANDGLYPKLFYRVQHIFVGDDAFRSIYQMRVFNATVAVIMLGFALFLGRKELRIGLIAAWTFTLVPLGMFIIPSTNPSSWAFTGVATNWMFQISAMRFMGNNNVRAFWNWLFYGLSAAFCIGSRSDAAAYLVLSTLIVVSIEYSHVNGRKLLSIVLPTIVCLSATVSILATSQGRKLADVASRETPIFNRLFYNTIHFIEIPSGVLGVNFGPGIHFGLGWLDTPMPPIVGIFGVSLFAIITADSLRMAGRNRISPAATITAFGYITVMLILNQGRYVIPEIVQPRYVLPLLALFIGIVSAGNETFDASMRRKNWRHAFIFMLTLTQALSIFTYIRRYVTGLDNPFALNLNSNREWWYQNYISPNYTFLITSISFSIFLTLMWKLITNHENVYQSK